MRPNAEKVILVLSLLTAGCLNGPAAGQASIPEDPETRGVAGLMPAKAFGFQGQVDGNLSVILTINIGQTTRCEDRVAVEGRLETDPVLFATMVIERSDPQLVVGFTMIHGRPPPHAQLAVHSRRMTVGSQMVEGSAGGEARSTGEWDAGTYQILLAARSLRPDPEDLTLASASIRLTIECRDPIRIVGIEGSRSSWIVDVLDLGARGSADAALPFGALRTRAAIEARATAELNGSRTVLAVANVYDTGVVHGSLKIGFPGGQRSIGVENPYTVALVTTAPGGVWVQLDDIQVHGPDSLPQLWVAALPVNVTTLQSLGLNEVLTDDEAT